MSTFSTIGYSSRDFRQCWVPTLYSNSILLWHLLQTENGDRISYLDTRGIELAEISLTELESCRHILGWCSDSKFLAGRSSKRDTPDYLIITYTGTPEANYVIGRSWLKGVGAQSRLKDIFVTRGPLIKSDHRAVYGKREKSARVFSGIYRASLAALSKKYFVLWDVEHKGGWLINGTNALLHLLRASLEFNKTDDQKFAFLFKPEKFEEAQHPYTVSAAMEVLMNPVNLDLELYNEGPHNESNYCAYFRVRDRINELYEVLEKLIDYQAMIADGEREDNVPRKHLEGWDFKDIATSEDPIYPCLAKLRTVGKGWVDFTRSLQATFLFGRGFGSLIDPVEGSYACKHWAMLSPKMYYLALSMEDLSRITDRLGHPRANPPRLTKSIIWYPNNPDSNATCSCRDYRQEHCQFAQILWPVGMSQVLPRWTNFPPKDLSAVVFGHNADFGWIWPDIGSPKKGEPPLSDDESDDDDYEDSGIGSSVSSIKKPQEIFQPCLKNEDYKIAIICALPTELMAVRSLFDDFRDEAFPQHENDTNTYALGRLGCHNVVAAGLAYGEYGMNAATKVASDIGKSFPAVKWYFVVGIGGGVPSRKRDIRLGDVVVSTGVIQHDIGKAIQRESEFHSTGIVQRPHRSLMTALCLIQSDPGLHHGSLDPHIQQIVDLRPEYERPSEVHDRLFHSHVQHEEGQDTCNNCKGPEISKVPRPAGPRVHYGLIASGNQVIKDAIRRDRIGAELDVLCCEMEGAGVMAAGESGHCLIIRGICDYADSHKNDIWHNYAAATAAAYTKFFLLRLRNMDILDRGVVYIRERPAPLLKRIEVDRLHMDTLEARNRVLPQPLLPLSPKPYHLTGKFLCSLILIACFLFVYLLCIHLPRDRFLTLFCLV